jgi:hypothetical protein
MLLACFPFSKSERMSGAWAVGWETNSFYEGGKASPDYLRFERTPNPDPRDARVTKHAKLFLAPKSGPVLPQDGKLRVLQIDFIGRRESCSIVPGEHDIVVDRIVSATLIGVTG